MFNKSNQMKNQSQTATFPIEHKKLSTQNYEVQNYY